MSLLRYVFGRPAMVSRWTNVCSGHVSCTHKRASGTSNSLSTRIYPSSSASSLLVNRNFGTKDTVSTIEYRVMRPEDEDEVRELFYTYFRWEPLSMGMNVEVPRECKRYVDYALAEGLHNGLSMVAVDKATNTIACFAISVVATPDNDQNWTYPPDDKDCQKLRKAWNIFSKLYHEVNLFKMYRVDKIASIRGGGTAERYFSKGIATTMVQHMCNLATERGFKFIVTETTSEFTRRIWEKQGASVVREVNYQEYIDDGTLNMPPDSPHKEVTLFVKRLDTGLAENITI